METIQLLHVPTAMTLDAVDDDLGVDHSHASPLDVLEFHRNPANQASSHSSDEKACI